MAKRERERKLCELEFEYNGKPAHLFKATFIQAFGSLQKVQ